MIDVGNIWGVMSIIGVVILGITWLMIKDNDDDDFSAP